MTQTFKNLGIIVKNDQNDRAVYATELSPGKPKLVRIDYTQPGYQDPSKVWRMGMFDDKMSPEVRARLKALSVGDEVCIHTCKNGKFSELVDVTYKSDIPQKSSGGGYQKKGGWTGKPKGNDDGAQVGNALTNAATLLPEGSSSGDLAKMAWEIILVGEVLKIQLKDYRDNPQRVPQSLPSSVAKKEPEIVEQEEDLIDDNLDDMDW